jgi:hypothetical protein
MSDVSETLARQRLFRKAAIVAVLVPAALLAGCAQQQPAPPPAQPVQAAPPPPPPAPAPAPMVRG